MKILEKNKAIGLRQKGMTFNEILKEVPASKSSLSYWLRDIKLTDEQLARICYKNEKIKEKFIIFNNLRKKQAEAHKNDIINIAVKEIDKISERELKLIGIALYWAEGYKATRCKNIDFTNSDPNMIMLMMAWFRRICEVPNEKFRLRVQCHGEEKLRMSEEYWSNITAVPLSQFTKGYVRISPTSKKKMGNLLPCGVCHIRISDISLLTKIKGWVKGLSGAIV